MPVEMLPPPPNTASEPLEHSKALTTDQSLFLLQKIIGMYEKKTAKLAPEAKLRQRLKEAGLAQVRQVAQWWVPVGERVCKASLRADTFEYLQDHIRTNDLIDTEIGEMTGA